MGLRRYRSAVGTSRAAGRSQSIRRTRETGMATDANERGFLGVGGSHDLQHLANQVAADVVDPETGVSIGQRLRAKMRVAALAPTATEVVRSAAKIAADADK